MQQDEAAELTSAQKAGLSKRRAYDARIRAALAELVADTKRRSIGIQDVCTHAGVESDSIYKIHHRALKEFVESEIEAWLGRKRPKRKSAAQTDEQSSELVRLREEKRELERKLLNAQGALNMMGQMLEGALAARGASAVVPLRRRRSDA